MVWGSRSRASATAEPVQPWASSNRAYHRSRSRGVGDRIIRRRKSLASICHCSRNRSISLTPITNPFLTPRRINPTPLQLYPMLLRISPWLWFSITRDFEAYDALIRLRPSGIEVLHYVTPLAPERRAGEAIPESHATLLEQAMTAVRGKIAPEKADSTYAELARTIAPLEHDRARRVLDYFKMYPEKPVSEIESMALATVERSVTLPAATARQLEEFGVEEGESGWGNIITRLIERSPMPTQGLEQVQPAQPFSGSIEQPPLAFQESEDADGSEPAFVESSHRPLELPEDPVSVQFKNKVVWNLVHSGVKADFYTIGYSGRDIDQFVEILKAAGVVTVVDVRHAPVSQYKPDFSKDNLKRHLESHGFEYVHRGDLGVPREIRAQAVGKPDRSGLWDWYDATVVPNITNGAVEVLRELLKQPMAFMCVETDPTACHRHRLFLALEQSGLSGFDL